MKRVLITGANSYIGTSVENWLKKEPEAYQVDTLDMQNPNWRAFDFSGYDTVFHVAGIAHQKETKENAQLYYSVNGELAVEAAKKAKSEGIGQFILLSSMSVYGMDTGIITKETFPNPQTHYGKSKLQAETDICKLRDEIFCVTVLRPPMVYGSGCKGNYQELVKLATGLPVFPVVKNQRSMIYIDNLCQFVKLMIDNKEVGLFFPQNAEYTNTSEMVKRIADVKGHKLCMVKGFGWAVKLMMKVPGKMGKLVRKAFGSLQYEMTMSEYKENYRKTSLKESIEKTERM